MNKPVIKFFRLEFIQKFKHDKLLYYTKKEKSTTKNSRTKSGRILRQTYLLLINGQLWLPICHLVSGKIPNTAQKKTRRTIECIYSEITFVNQLPRSSSVTCHPQFFLVTFSKIGISPRLLKTKQIFGPVQIANALQILSYLLK